MSSYNSDTFLKVGILPVAVFKRWAIGFNLGGIGGKFRFDAIVKLNKWMIHKILKFLCLLWLIIGNVNQSSHATHATFTKTNQTRRLATHVWNWNSPKLIEIKRNRQPLTSIIVKTFVKNARASHSLFTRETNLNFQNDKGSSWWKRQRSWRI